MDWHRKPPNGVPLSPWANVPQPVEWRQRVAVVALGHTVEYVDLCCMDDDSPHDIEHWAKLHNVRSPKLPLLVPFQTC